MNKIFVSIASYRDPELPKTVENLISNAEHPELLKIVIFEQNDPTDLSIYEIYPIEQVLVLQTHYSNAKGPVWARAIIQKEYQNEEYYLQIDSHMRTIKHWDTLLKHILELVPEPAVLTQYPPEYTKILNQLDSDEIDSDEIRSGLYIQGFGIKDHFTRIQSDIINPINKRNFPYTSKAWAACFSFSKGTVVKDVPYDTSLEYLFFGEELDITLRLYTRGYYFFSPHISIFYTLFKRDHRRTYWEDIHKDIREPRELLSRTNLWTRIYDNEIGPNRFGTIRTIKDYMKFANIDSFKECKLNLKAKSFKRFTKRELFR
jgi:[Skp1-protein]-hydroxyproline N-acetylglucosaminyltransferase